MMFEKRKRGPLFAMSSLHPLLRHLVASNCCSDTDSWRMSEIPAGKGLGKQGICCLVWTPGQAFIGRDGLDQEGKIPHVQLPKAVLRNR